MSSVLDITVTFLWLLNYNLNICIHRDMWVSDLDFYTSMNTLEVGGWYTSSHIAVYDYITILLLFKSSWIMWKKLNMYWNITSLLQMSFPGHLHLVLVLRPKTHLQTTGTDLGFRFSQDDFALKMPVRADENPLWYKKIGFFYV